MKETNFVKQNKEKWHQSEQFIRGSENDPEKLNTLFVQVVDDLSYSQTFYKHRSVRVYLNNIAREFFSNINDTRKEKKNRFKNFWLEELPQIIIFCRRELLISLIVFSLAVTIGVFSSANDEDFTASILGDAYVAETLENIEKGDPMAIYKGMNQFEMSIRIIRNNLWVAFQTYFFGLFMSIGTLFILLSNGIMVGSFQYFFAEHNLLATSAMTIWLHGTLEISCIIIAGGAGLTLGSGLLFPGTFSRLQAFQMSAIRSVKLMLGIMPIIFTAGIIESFITRYTDAPIAIKIALIILSAAFIIGYFIVYPWWKSKKGFAHPIKEAKLQPNTVHPINFNRIKNNAEILSDAFGFYKRNFNVIFKWVLVLSLGTTALHYFTYTEQLERYDFDFVEYLFMELYFVITLDSLPKLLIAVLCVTVVVTLVMHLLLKEQGVKLSRTDHFIGFLKCLFITGVAYALVFLSAPWGYWLYALLFATLLFNTFGTLKRESFGKTWNLFTSRFGQLFSLQFILFFTVSAFLLLLVSPLLYFYTQVITISFTQMDNWMNEIATLLEIFVKFFAFNLLLPILAICMGLLYYSAKEVTSASFLKESISKINLRHLKREV